MPNLTHFPLQASTITYGASTFWGQLQEDVPAGAVGYNDFRVAQRGAGANMSCDVSLGSNGKACAYVPYLSVATGGMRRVEMAALSNSGTPGSPGSDWIATFTAADATNPRIDSVYLVLRDSTLDLTGAQDAKLQVVTGVATPGATLDNRSGAGAAPSSNCMLLADVLIPATATTVTTANIRDRRALGLQTMPGVGVAVDSVPLIPMPGAAAAQQSFPTTSAHQAAVLCYLPRRIVGATRIRWQYKQTGTPTTGNYVIAICDASGRPIVNTGSVAYAGVAVSQNPRSEVIAATTLEAGMYWVFFGHTLTAGATPVFLSVGNTMAATPNTLLYSTSGGVTVPASILSMTDAYTTAPANAEAVPVISLSVG